MFRKSGFTLIELLVYMAILSFIIVVAGRVFSDSTVMRVRSQNMVRTAEEVGRVSHLISEDISQTGVKAWGMSSASSEGPIYIVSQIPEVYMDITDPDPVNHDSSSFQLFRGHAELETDNSIKFDSLVFRKADIDDNGEFLGIREISWAANEKGELRRWCKTIDGSYGTVGTVSDECPEEALPVLIASNLKRFSFHASAPGLPPENVLSDIAEDMVFPTSSDATFRLLPASNNGATGIGFEYITSDNETNTIAQAKHFAKNPIPSNSKFNELSFAKSPYSECLSFEIRKGETYVVEFDMPFLENVSGLISEELEAARKDSSSTQFLPGQDHISVGLRYSSNGNSISDAVVSPDVLLYAPQSEEAASQPRYAEFSVRGEPSEDVCAVLTFAFYSPLAYRGKLRFTNFKIYRKQTGAYHFVSKANKYEDDFAHIYATEDDNPAKKLNHKKTVKAFELLLEIDRNGEIAGTYSKDSTGMAIPVPNNGGTYR